MSRDSLLIHLNKMHEEFVTATGGWPLEQLIREGFEAHQALRSEDRQVRREGRRRAAAVRAELERCSSTFYDIKDACTENTCGSSDSCVSILAND